MPGERLLLVRVGPGEPLPGELRTRVSILDYVEKVKPVVLDVKRRGWEAAREYSLRFDGAAPEEPLLGRDMMEWGFEEVDERVRRALRVAASALSRYHVSTRPPEAWVPGARLRWLPVRRVGLYAPGGAHPYPSTVLHTAIPARSAGASSVVVATPPRRGRGGAPVHPLMLAAAYVAGVDEVLAVGGAQGVALLAYGGGVVEPVDMVAGPGGPYVQAAKLLVQGDVGIDMVAGPTELAVIAGPGSDERLVALDMAAEAEHGPLSVAALFTWDEGFAERVLEELRGMLGGDAGRAVAVVAADAGEAVRLADEMAAEHLVVYGDRGLWSMVVERAPAAGIVSYGVPPALLDYAYGPSHVLPTGGAARWRGGLGVHDFMRAVAYVEPLTTEGLPRELLEAGVVLAEAEGFRFHAESLRARLGEEGR